MARARFLLHRISACMNLYSRCYYILKNAVSNTYNYCLEFHNVETGDDKELEAIDAMRPIEDASFGGAAGKGGAAKQNKAP